jgi:general secretion pathway protein A
MYEKHFGFTRSPFSLLPDPSFLFMSRRHAMALTLLKYSLMSKHAFTVITGEVGSGKTTLLHRLLEEVHGRYTAGMINFTDGHVTQLWPWIMQAFGLPYTKKSAIQMYDQFLVFLKRERAAGRPTVLIVDEAQNLAQSALENLRIVSNVNAKEVLLQIVLVGQPEFRVTLKRPDFRQLNQRVSLFYRLDPLGEVETREYILHRLRIAGCARPVFDEAAIALIWHESGGVARRINTLCDMSLIYGFGNNKQIIGSGIVHQMLADRRDVAVETEPARARPSYTERHAPSAPRRVARDPSLS